MIRKSFNLIMESLKAKGLPYLCVGIWNTLFGILLYSLFIIIFGERHYLLLGVINSIIAITSAFLLHKFLVFKTKGNLIKEYLKFCSVYFSSSILGIFFLYIFVDIFAIPAIISNIIITMLLLGYCFIGNVLFAFRNS